MGEWSKLANIGPEIERQLYQVGIDTPEELATVGTKQAWLRIQSMDASACMNRLLALEGALQGVKKTMLPPECKAELAEFYGKNKKMDGQ